MSASADDKMISESGYAIQPNHATAIIHAKSTTQLRLLIKLNNQLARCPQSSAARVYRERKTEKIANELVWNTLEGNSQPLTKNERQIVMFSNSCPNATQQRFRLQYTPCRVCISTGYVLRTLVIMRKENALSFCFRASIANRNGHYRRGNKRERK